MTTTPSWLADLIDDSASKMTKPPLSRWGRRWQSVKRFVGRVILPLTLLLLFWAIAWFAGGEFIGLLLRMVGWRGVMSDQARFVLPFAIGLIVLTCVVLIATAILRWRWGRTVPDPVLYSGDKWYGRAQNGPKKVIHALRSFGSSYWMALFLGMIALMAFHVPVNASEDARGRTICQDYGITAVSAEDLGSCANQLLIKENVETDKKAKAAIQADRKVVSAEFCYYTHEAEGEKAMAKCEQSKLKAEQSHPSGWLVPLSAIVVIVLFFLLAVLRLGREIRAWQPPRSTP